MNSTFFASFSSTMFTDLYEMNIRSYHKHTIVYEILNNEVINTIEDIDPHNFIRKDTKSYMLCFGVDELAFVTHDPKKQRVMLLDNSGMDKNIEHRKTKDFLNVVYENNIVEVISKPNAYIYYDDFYSLSWTEYLGFERISVSKPKSFDLTNIKYKP